jgi:hypothetical protein
MQTVAEQRVGGLLDGSRRLLAAAPLARRASSTPQVADPGQRRGSQVVPNSPSLRYAPPRAYCIPLVSPRLRATGAVVFGLMAEHPRQQVRDVEGERVRRVRLRADGQRPLAVNLEETISLTRKLFELRDAALRAR